MVMSNYEQQQMIAWAAIEPQPITEKTCATTQPGDIWILGRHRLLCGDATNPSNIARLLNDQQPAFYCCDPPFNLDPRVQAAMLNRLQARQIIWISGTPSVYEVWRHLTRRDYRWTLFWDGGTAMGVPNQHRPNISTDVLLCFGSDGLFRKQHAIPVFGTPGLAVPHVLKIGRDFYTNRYTVLQKPLKLFAGLMELLSEPGDLVCDLFVGSGTTIIAAEQRERTCYAMEINPQHCDVIVKRWEELTNQKAHRI